MDIGRDDTARMQDMLDYAKEAIGFVDGVTYEEFFADRRTQLAVTRCIEIIGEAAARIDPKTRESLPQIPWRSAVSMRNRLVHGYTDVNERIVFDTATTNLPPLVAELERVLTPPGSN